MAAKSYGQITQTPYRKNKNKQKTTNMNKLMTWTAVLLTASLTTSTASAQRAYGIDVYAGDGSINWTSVSEAGAHFAWTKATEGTYYKEANFVANMDNGKGAGVLMGPHMITDVRTCLLPPPSRTYVLEFCQSLDHHPVVPGSGARFGMAMCRAPAAWATGSVPSSRNVSAGNRTFNPLIDISSCNACELSGSGGGFAWLANYNGANSKPATLGAFAPD